MIERLGLHWKHSEDELRIKLNQVIDELNNIEQRLPYRIMPKLDSTIKQLSSQLSKDYIVPKESANFVQAGDIGMQPTTVTTSSPTGEVTYVTPEPSQQVQNVTQSGSVCNPKKEEQSPLIQELTRNQAYAIEEAKLQAVEAYKKRLVEKLVNTPINWLYVGTAIELVEEADLEPKKYLTAEGMRAYDGSKWV